MRTPRALPVLALLAAGGCWPTHDPAPEEEAIGIYESAEKEYGAGRYAEAAPGYEFAIKHRNRWKDPYVKLARCYEAMGRRDDAVRTLEQLLAFDRFDEEGRRELARIEAMRKP